MYGEKNVQSKDKYRIMYRCPRDFSPGIGEYMINIGILASNLYLCSPKN